jgi:fibrillarin-like pre-rRNA processing protein
MKESFAGVFSFDKYIATINAVPGKKVYDERLLKGTPETGGRELRIWDPFRSKLGGAIRKGLKTFPFTPGSKTLYLGASTGTTISHLSDIVGGEGEIYAVEIAPQCMKSLLALCDLRENIIPIHADAKKPSEYEEVGKVDVIYMDVAQPDQSDILNKNALMFLEKGGIAMLCVKSQSIDVTKTPKQVFKIVLDELDPYFEVLERYELEPFDKDHLFLVLKKK